MSMLTVTLTAVRYDRDPSPDHRDRRHVGRRVAALHNLRVDRATYSSRMRRLSEEMRAGRDLERVRRLRAPDGFRRSCHSEWEA